MRLKTVLGVAVAAAIGVAALYGIDLSGLDVSAVLDSAPDCVCADAGAE